MPSWLYTDQDNKGQYWIKDNSTLNINYHFHTALQIDKEMLKQHRATIPKHSGRKEILKIIDLKWVD